MHKLPHILCSIFVVAMLGYVGKQMTAKPKSSIDFAALGSLPIQGEGRVRPRV